MKRYSRQLKFLSNYIDANSSLEDFQKNISNKKIALIGSGGVGSVLGELLIRGGFLNLKLVDNDLIDETNIQRQVFFEKDIGKLKALSLKKHLELINSKSTIEVIADILDESNISNFLNDSDLIIDCSDNFDTRIFINSYCEKNNKDWIYSAAVKSQISCCIFRGTDRLFSRTFPRQIKDEKCCDVGVLSSTTFTAASMVFNLVLKYFLKIDEKELIKMDLWSNKIHVIKLK